MKRYIDADALLTDEKLHTIPFGSGKSSGRVIIFVDEIEKLIVTDVVPKSEVEKLVQDGIRLVQENETLKDNNEHLAVILEETKSEVERLQAEKDALIKNYAECMKDYAREIFAEIESKKMFLKDCVGNMGVVVLFKDISELKKKYTENIPSPAPEEKYFSPQDVRNMTPREVHDNYSAIIKSMELWN